MLNIHKSNYNVSQLKYTYRIYKLLKHCFYSGYPSLYLFLFSKILREIEIDFSAQGSVIDPKNRVVLF